MGHESVTRFISRLAGSIYFYLRGERRLMLISTILLLNLRTSLVVINQLWSMYIPDMRSEATDIFHLSA